MRQAANLANHPRVFRHVALMPDCHVGYGMPIGGVVACAEAVIPNAVGVDIGCGMCAVRTGFEAAGRAFDGAVSGEPVDIHHNYAAPPADAARKGGACPTSARRRRPTRTSGR